MTVLSIFSHKYSVFFKTKNAEKLGLFLLFQRKIFISGYLAVNQFLAGGPIPPLGEVRRGFDRLLGRLGGGLIAWGRLGGVRLLAGDYEGVNRFRGDEEIRRGLSSLLGGYLSLKHLIAQIF